jgi:exodeoxyribonuclease VII small subunit
MSPESSRKPASRGKPAKEETIPFEDALSELESIVEELEDGSLSLDNSLSRFERGIQLSKQLQKQLTAAEARVRKLVGQEGGGPLLEELEEESEAEVEVSEEGEEEDDDGLEEKGNPTLPF